MATGVNGLLGHPDRGALTGSLGGLSVLIDPAFGEFAQSLICFLLFRERDIE